MYISPQMGIKLNTFYLYNTSCFVPFNAVCFAFHSSDNGSCDFCCCHGNISPVLSFSVSSFSTCSGPLTWSFGCKHVSFKSRK